MQLEMNDHEDASLSPKLYAEVVIPLAVEGTFTYRVPRELEDYTEVGKRAVVQFGKRHIYTGIIFDLHHNEPTGQGIKALLDILDPSPVLLAKHITFWQWMSQYYMCQLGEIMDAALPAYLKLKSETQLVLNPSFAKSESDDFTQNESFVIEALQHEGELSIKSVQDLLQLANVMPIIRKLHNSGAVLAIEDIKSHYRPKTEKYIGLSATYLEEENLSAAFEVLESKKATQRQSQLLTRFIQIGRFDEKVLKRDLLDAETNFDSQLKSLIKKGILEETEVFVDRWQIAQKKPEPFELNEFQEAAYRDVKSSLAQQKPVLLHGITGSGKTHIYLKLLQDFLSNSGDQALYLLPEIALTTQLINRLSKYFGKSIAVYHSRLSNNERYELYQGTQDGKYQLIVGARSSVFLPFHQLKMIIVDEEHESSFKQQDPNPRYNGRDAAIYLAFHLKIPIVLGSATPAVESYHNAQVGKYSYVFLGKRHGEIHMPKIKLIDLKQEQKTKSVKQNLSRELKNEIKYQLSQGNQTILFQNRRGYAPVIECGKCGWVPYCKNCDIILTYHKFNQSLSCHYCGYTMGMPQKCQNCGSFEMKMKGTGTERLEDELSLIFPEAMVTRMDMDTTRKKNSLEKIITAVEKGQVDILVGTQMVTKGLDFEKVKLVGVVSGDSLMYHPDFRATERAFQILVQVAGRSGRKGKQGEVSIQTYQPGHFIYQLLLSHNQTGFYTTELQQRQLFKYPPYFRMIRVVLKHKQVEKVNVTGDALYTLLERQIARKFILGPEFGSNPRLKNKYHKLLHIKMPNNPTEILRTKEFLKKTIELIKSNPKTRTVDVIVDVDPY